VETTFAAIARRRAVGWAEIQSVKLMVRPLVSPAVMVLPAGERCSGAARTRVEPTPRRSRLHVLLRGGALPPRPERIPIISMGCGPHRRRGRPRFAMRPADLALRTGRADSHDSIANDGTRSPYRSPTSVARIPVGVRVCP
jgi:hypothetical protein